MNYRTALLFPAEDLGEAGTKTINIDVDKPISRIEITYKTTKGSAGMTLPAPANIPKIELVDGSTVLHSTTGYENQALAYYSRPGVLMDHGQHLDGNSELDVYAIDFGRYLWDPDLAFNPTVFKNPQLKVTYDEDASDTSAGAGTLEVWAHIFDEKEVSPMGFLSAIEQYDYTCGADNSYETISLPEDRSYRQILVRAYQAAYEPWYSIDEARFDEGTLDRIPWEFTDLEMYFRRMKSHWPLISYPFQALATAAGTIFYVPTTEYWGAFVGVQQSGGVVPYVNAGGARGGKLTIYAASTVQITGHIQGWLPWHCYQFPMGKQDDISDWYDPAGKKPRLRLRASTGATSSTGQVVIEELYKY